MFTGIIEARGVIVNMLRHGSGMRLVIRVSKTPKQIKRGSSVAVNGICLTVSDMKKGQLFFDVMEESVKKTTIGSWKKGDRVNVESSLRLGDEVGGHFVFGHVDGVVKIQNAEFRMQNYILTFELPKKIKKYVVPQGSVAIDGVSLTVARVGKSDFTVSLVDFTLEHTTLKDLQKGDRVNIECDMLAKYTLNAKLRI